MVHPVLAQTGEMRQNIAYGPSGTSRNCRVAATGVNDRDDTVAKRGVRIRVLTDRGSRFHHRGLPMGLRRLHGLPAQHS
jgi:hypothetical protein